MGLTPSELEKKSFMLGNVFKPATPINREDLFAGRKSQVLDVVDAINQQGQHAVLYGERGVGKTSLANMIVPKLRAACPVFAAQINCMSQDTYSAIWKRAFEEIGFKSEETGMVIDEAPKKLLDDYTGPHADDISPDIVRRLLHLLGQDNLAVVVLDEFDTVEIDETRTMMSDTLKFLSDRNVPATVILIGVAHDVDVLVKNHRSLERCLRQIHMPRMSDLELQQIIVSGLSAVEMMIDVPAIEEICHLAKGLPHYAHLLGLYSGRAALAQKTLRVVQIHVQAAVKQAIAKAQASIQSDYSKAVTSSRPEALYTQVLLACAMAETDDMGWFYPRDVREPLELILQREYKIESFARHIHSFCQEARGPVLIANGKPDHPRFRFENPLMQPYVLIRGLADQMMKPEDLKPKDTHGENAPDLF